MTTFVTIADQGSLTAAARTLEVSLPSVVRTLATLEGELGARLFNRTTRRVALTEEGKSYLASCRTILASVAEAEAELGTAATEPIGSLVVTAPVLFGQLYVAPIVTQFVRDHPRMRCDLVLQDRMVDLVEEGIDVGVRIGVLPDSNLVSHPVGAVRRVVVASPAYLREHGTPSHPRELMGRNCVRFTPASGPSWTFYDSDRALDVPISGNLGFNHAAPAVDACVAGAGFGMFISYQVARFVRAGALSLVLEGFEPPRRPVQVVYPHRRHLPVRTRAFVAAVREGLRATLPPLEA
jgi:DNA-binding transcriptional LysR family regulator